KCNLRRKGQGGIREKLVPAFQTFALPISRDAHPRVGGRAALEQSEDRNAVVGLYQCGSSSPPGGGVSGIPGHNAAREILKDWKRLQRSEEHTSELQSLAYLVCRLLLEKKKAANRAGQSRTQP